MKKRILSAFLCLCMMLTLAPAAFASDTGGTEDGTTPPSTGENTPATGGGTGEDNKPQDTIKVTFAEEGETTTLTANAEADANGKLEITLLGSVDEKNFADGKQVGIILTITPAAGGEATTYTGKLALNTETEEITFTPDESTVDKENKLPETYAKVNEKTEIKLEKDTSGDPEPVSTPNILEAPLHDTRLDKDETKGEGIADEELIKDYVVTSEKAEENTEDPKTFTQTIKITGTDLQKHQNADKPEAMGYWVGFFAAVPSDEVTSVNYVKGDKDGNIAADNFDEVDGKKGISVYFDRGESETPADGTCTLAWLKGNDTIVKVEYTVDMTGVKIKGQKVEDGVTLDFGTLDPKPDMEVKLNATEKKIELSGTVERSFLTASDKLTVKIKYTIGGKTGTHTLLMSVDENDKLVVVDEGNEALPEDYKIDTKGITISSVNVPEGVKPIETPVTDVTSISKDNQEAATKVAESIKTENVNDIAEAAAAELNKIVENTTIEKGQEIVVFLAVEAKEYNTNSDGTVGTFKLDITPKYEVVHKDSAPTGKNAKPLTSIEKEITITVQLPAKFADANDANVYARHAHDNKIDILHVLVNDSRKGTFTMKGFSEVEFFKDERSVTVKYNGNKQTSSPVLTLANVSSELATDTKEGYTFKGWALKENATTADYSGTLTETMLDAMIEAAKGNTLNLYPVFETKSSGNTTTSGGGGGNKRPSSGNDNTSTGTTPPSNYGDNPTTPSTPSTPASKTGFSDVVAGGWYESAVQYMKDNGLMAGTSATTFAPDATTTRGMIVTILYRLEKEPAAAAASSFSDIAAGEWYSDAVAWAAANNIVSGYENGTFGAGDVITREQMAAILFRYASFKGYDVTGAADLSAFADAAQVSAYAADAMKWANAAGLISGTSTTTLAPAGSATRAQAASILMRFCENVAK